MVPSHLHLMATATAASMFSSSRSGSVAGLVCAASTSNLASSRFILAWSDCVVSSEICLRFVNS